MNPITGEGICYAVKGAKLLGKAILEGRPENYEKYWRKSFGKELTIDRRVSRLVYNLIPKAISHPRFAKKAFIGLLTGEPVSLKSVLSWVLREDGPAGI